MPRATDLLVVLTYATLAIVAALAFDRLGLMGSGLAWMTGAVIFLIAGQVHAGVARAEERRRFEAEIHELKSGQHSLIEELEQAGARLDALDGGRAPAAAQTQTQAGAEAQAAGPAAPAAAPAEPASWPAAPRVEAATPGPELGEALKAAAQDAGGERLIAELIARLDAKPGADAQGLGPGPATGLAPGDDTGTAQMIRAALDDNRVDLYLQPVVGLPQRRTYFYEGFSRIRDGRGYVMGPDRFLAAAERHGLIGEMDNLLLFRCIQIIRRLTRADRKIGIFCNISPRSLADEDFFPPFLEFLRRNSDLASALIFEMSQEAFQARSSSAARHMARLSDYGFRFSVDRVTTLDLDLAEMQRASVRFAKVEAGRLIAAARSGEPIAGRAPGQIAPEDIAGLFARYGVDLIAEKIEAEPQVVEILDLDIAYGQGHLFGAPRPVREDALSEELADRGQRRVG
jgi:cyclic-di-GMP phosphodiesterase, flagellum assembly factor TipF